MKHAKILLNHYKNKLNINQHTLLFKRLKMKYGCLHTAEQLARAPILAYTAREE